MASLERSQMPYFVGYNYRHALKFLKALAARIDLEHFPGSC
jgi:hypothetical protein